MTGLIALATLFIILGGLAILKVASDTDEYSEMVLRQIDRNDELEQAYLELTETMGREPTVRELWAYCPRKENG